VNGWRFARFGSNPCGLFWAGLTLAQLACSAGGPGNGSSTTNVSAAGATTVGTGGTSSAGPVGGTSSVVLAIAGSATDDGGSGGKPSDQVVTSLPPGFHATEIGGYKLGERVEGGGGSGMAGGASTGGAPFGGSAAFGGTAGAGGGDSAGSAGAGGAAPGGDCGNILLGVVRDFKGADENGHADFETKGIQGADITPGMVATTLGPDKKPVYASMCEIGHAAAAPTCPYGAQNTSKALFDQWYRDTPGVNDAYTVSIYLAPQPLGLFTFQSLAYFPVDGAGFMGMAKADDGMQHNFGFTTELHTQFLYKGGETFTFEGDDDVWVFINDKLAADLGGLHPMQARPVMLDAVAAQLGITKGTIYPLDLFHAERHTTASTFRIDTNLSFVDCGKVIPGKVK
jgi:fibro-slime domain-containing protein